MSAGVFSLLCCVFVAILSEGSAEWSPNHDRVKKNGFFIDRFSVVELPGDKTHLLAAPEKYSRSHSGGRPDLGSKYVPPRAGGRRRRVQSKRRGLFKTVVVEVVPIHRRRDFHGGGIHGNRYGGKNSYAGSGYNGGKRNLRYKGRGQHRRPLYKTIIEERTVPIVTFKKVPKIVMRKEQLVLPVVRMVPKVVDLTSGKVISSNTAVKSKP